MMLSPLGLGSSDAIAGGANPIQFVPVVKCPPLKIYTAEQSKQIGEARKKLRAIDPKSIMLDMGDDYFLLRDECRRIETK